MARRFDLEELLRLPSYYLPTVSPTRDQVAFYWNRTGRIELYTMDLRRGGEPGQVTDGQLPRSPGAGFSWLHDGSAIVFPKDNDGDEQHNLYLLNLTDGRTDQLTDARAQHLPGHCSPDGRELLVMSNRNGQMNVFALDLATRILRQLTRFASPAHTCGWSADGKWVFVTANETDDLTNEDVYRVSRDGTKVELLYSSGKGTQDSAARVSDDGRYLAVNSDASGFCQPVVLDLTDGTTRRLGDGSGEEYASDFSPDGAKLLSLLARDARTYVVETDLASGRRQVLPLPAGVVYGARYLWDGRILVNHTDARHRPRLLAFDPRTNKLSVVLEAEYGRLSPDDFVDAHYVSFPSDDGLTIYGIFYKPPVEPGKKLPAIVFVHGGPTAQDYLMFNPAVQVFANRGFAVLQVNYRGSIGYGRAFQDMNIGDIGGGDARDVAAGARFLAQDPDIDPERILCAGGSYGGYMTYRQLTRFPDLWAGGIAWVGITDWERLYEEDMEHFKYYCRMLFGGSPQEVPERYREASPIHEAHRLRAPLMIIHGVTDPRCPISQARLFKQRLEELGKVEGRDFFYHELGQQGHGSVDMEEMITTFRLMEGFLARFADTSA